LRLQRLSPADLLLQALAAIGAETHQIRLETLTEIDRILRLARHFQPGQVALRQSFPRLQSLTSFVPVKTAVVPARGPAQAFQTRQTPRGEVLAPGAVPAGNADLPYREQTLAQPLAVHQQFVLRFEGNIETSGQPGPPGIPERRRFIRV